MPLKDITASYLGLLRIPLSRGWLTCTQIQQKVIKLIPVEQDMGVRTIPVNIGHGKKLDKTSKSHSELTYLYM